jgi:autotransporter-associated beta strand protein
VFSTGNVTLNGDLTLNRETTGNDFQLNGVVSGTGSITKVGVGTFLLSNANTYNGSTTNSAGKLSLTNALALQNSALDTTNSVTGNTTVGLSLSGTATGNLTLGGLTGNKNLADVFTTGGNNGSTLAALTLNPGTGVTHTYSGAIANRAANMTLTKTGNGTQILGGTNGYTGNTTVTAGTLLINGSTTSNSLFSVAAGATLGGDGTVGGATTINGILAPGNSIGTLNIAANTTWAGAATAGAATDWKFELGAGNTSDLLNITGDFLKNTTAGSVFRFDFLAGTAIGTFKLTDWTGTTGFSASDFSYTNLGVGNTGTFAFNGSQLDFIVTVIPEPSTYAMLIGGLGLMAYLRRRRQS